MYDVEETYKKELNTRYRNNLRPSYSYSGTLRPVTAKRAVQMIIDDHETIIYANAKDKRTGYNKFFIAPKTEKDPEIRLINRINSLYGIHILPVTEIKGEWKRISSEDAYSFLKNRSEQVYGDYGISSSGERIFTSFFVEREKRAPRIIGKSATPRHETESEDRFTDIINTQYADKIKERDKFKQRRGEQWFDARMRYIQSYISPREAIRRIQVGEQVFGVRENGKWTKFYTTAQMKARKKQMKAKLTMLDRAVRMIRR